MLGALFLLALIGVLCARDALSFLFFWELMTLVPAAVILAGQRVARPPGTPSSPTSRSRTSAAPGTWIALLLLAHEGAIGDPTALSEGSGVQAVIAVAAIVGFGTKAGPDADARVAAARAPDRARARLGRDERRDGRPSPPTG